MASITRRSMPALIIPDKPVNEENTLLDSYQKWHYRLQPVNHSYRQSQDYENGSRLLKAVAVFFSC